MNAQPLKKTPAEDYGEDSIKMLKGLDADRKPPGMYIGDTDDGSGLHHMIYEVVDNGIDEVLAGHAKSCTVTLNPDGSCTVRDDGRGIPTGIKKDDDQVPEAFGCGDRLHGAACRRQVRPELLQGFGRSARCGRFRRQRAFDLAQMPNWREGKEHYIEFHNGNAVAPLKVVGDANGERGTEVSFLPSPETFHNVMEFDFATLEHRLRELAFLNSGAKIVLTDARHADVKREEFSYDGGTAAFVRISIVRSLRRCRSRS